MSEDLLVFYDGSDSFAARDMADATALWEALYEIKWEAEHLDELPATVWSERPLDQIATVTFDYQSDGHSAAPAGAEIIDDPEGGCKVKATWRQWAEKTGRGLICSENW